MAALLLLGVIVAIPAFAATIVVRPGQLAANGMNAGVQNSGTAGVRTNGNGSTLGTGAWVMDTGSDAFDDGEDNRTWVGTNALSGQPLANIDLLEYRTFVRPSSMATAGLTPWIRLEVDLTGDGDRDIRFEWIPIAGTQGPASVDAWDTWNALDDGWKYIGGGTEGTLLGFTDPTEREPLSTYIARAPSARLIPYLGQPSMTLRAGQVLPDDWTDLVSEVDGLRWQLDGQVEPTIIDFEPPFISASNAFGSQQNPGGSVSVVVPFHLSGINGAESSTSPGLYNGVTSSATWTLSDSMGPVPGASGVVNVPAGATTANVTVNVPGSRIPSDGSSKHFTLTLSSPVNAVVSAPATITVESYSRDTVTLVDPATGEWHYYNTAGVATKTIFYGNPGDYPIFGDWNGDGVETPGLYRQSDGFVYLRNSNTQGPADIQFFFGNPGDIPIAGDFDGDGDDSVSIYRPSQGRVFVINALGQNNGGLGPADYSYYFGNPGDKPFTGDFDADGIDSVGLHRESTGFVYFRLTNTQGVADNQFFFGNPGDRFVSGDWMSTGISTPALFRPSNTTMYFRYTNTQGNADFTFTAGQSTWIPVAGFVGN